MDSIEKLEKIKLGVYRICSALVSITEHECCCYGFSEEVDMAERFIEEYEKENKNENQHNICRQNSEEI